MAQSLSIVLPNTLASTSQEQGFLEGVQQVVQAAVSNGPTSTYPTKNLYIGQQFFDTSLQKVVVWNGTSWGSVGGGAATSFSGISITTSTWTGGTITGTIAGNPTFSGTITVTGGIVYTGTIAASSSAVVLGSGPVIYFDTTDTYHGYISNYGTNGFITYTPASSGGVPGPSYSHVWTKNLQSGGGNVATLTPAGVFTCVSVVQTSDERFKENWIGFDDTFVENLANLKSGNYDLIETKVSYVGIGAQSLEKFMPNAIENDPLTGYYAVNYGGAAMVSCVELAKDNLKLRDRISILEEQMTKLLSKMGA